ETLSINETASREFLVRRRSPTLPTIALAFLISFVAVVAGITAADYIGGPASVILLAFLSFGVLGWFTIMLTQNNRDLVLMTEFQNALFSSVANMNNLFLLIVKENGTIVYFSRDYQQIFADAKRYG